jgi:hypothetical protein
MAEVMSRDNRTLIERVRRTNKLLSLYVLALQDDTALQPEDHAKLTGALRALIQVIEEQSDNASSLDVTECTPESPGGSRCHTTSSATTPHPGRKHP